MTRTETVLSRELRNRRLDGLKFRRQVPIGPYVMDFLCYDRRLVVELWNWTARRMKIHGNAIATRGVMRGCDRKAFASCAFKTIPWLLDRDSWSPTQFGGQITSDFREDE